jgi:hypothetical protein
VSQYAIKFPGEIPKESTELSRAGDNMENRPRAMFKISTIYPGVHRRPEQRSGKLPLRPGPPQPRRRPVRAAAREYSGRRDRLSAGSGAV